MSILSRAYSGARKGVGGIKSLATVSNANKLLTGANRGLKTIGSMAQNAGKYYDQTLGNPMYMPQTELGQNVSNVLQTVGKLAN